MSLRHAVRVASRSFVARTHRVLGSGGWAQAPLTNLDVFGVRKFSSEEKEVDVEASAEVPVENTPAATPAEEETPAEESTTAAESIESTAADAAPPVKVQRIGDVMPWYFEKARLSTVKWIEAGLSDHPEFEEHPEERKVLVTLKVAELGLDEVAEKRLKLLCGSRYNRFNDVLKISCQDLPFQEQNFLKLCNTMAELIKESKEGEWCPDEVIEEIRNTPKKKKRSAEEWLMKDWVVDDR